MALPQITSETRFIFEYLFIGLNTVIVFVAGYYTIRFPNVFKILEVSLSRKKTSSVYISESEANEILKRARKVMTEKKLFLKKDLTQKEVAQEIGIQSYIFGKVLNENFGDNFNRFVNEYRVEKAKEILVDPSYLNSTIYAVVHDSGFKTESVFYTNFKKIVGMTPKEYQKKLETS